MRTTTNSPAPIAVAPLLLLTLPLASLLLVALTAGPALGQPAGPATRKASGLYADSANRFAIELPTDFKLYESESRLGSFRDDQGQSMALSRIDYPALPAWQKKRRQAFLESISKNLAGENRDSQLKSKRLQRVQGVPMADLHFTRKVGKTRQLVWMRLALFRNFVIVATAAVPASAKAKHKRRATTFVKSLRPMAAIVE